MLVRTPVALDGHIRLSERVPKEFPPVVIKCDRCEAVVFENKKKAKQLFDYGGVYEKYQEAIYRSCPGCGILFVSVSDFKLRSWPVFIGFLDTRAVKVRVKPLQAVVDKYNRYPRYLQSLEMEYGRLPKTHCFDTQTLNLVLKFKEFSPRKSEQVPQVIETILHWMVHHWQEVEERWSLKLLSPCKDLVYENEAQDFIAQNLAEAVEIYYRVEEEIGPGYP